MRLICNVESAESQNPTFAAPRVQKCNAVGMKKNLKDAVLYSRDIAMLVQYELITSLPSRLSCIILQEWLNMKSLMALDSAFCCHHYRQEFLDLLISDEFSILERVFINVNDASSFKVSKLLHRFGEKMRFIHLFRRNCWYFSDHFCDVECCLISPYCHHLTQVEFSGVENCRSTLQALLKNNPQIECLTVSDDNREVLLFPYSFEDLDLPKLSTLAVKGYKLGDETILGAMQWGNLVRLDLTWCDIFDESLLVQIARMCPRLRTLVLADVTIEPVTNGGLRDITAICPHIMHLDISGMWELVTDAGILSVVKNLKRLQSLNISEVARLTNLSLVYIYTYCAETIKTLMIDNQGVYGVANPTFSAGCVNTLLERCSQLHTLHIYDRYEGSTPFTFTFSSCTLCNLTTLAIGGYIVSDRNLAIIGTHGVNLQVLEIDSQYVHESIFGLANSHPKLRELHYDFRCAYNVNIPENLVRASRENVRPGLLVTLKSVQNGSTWRPTKPACFDF